MNSVERHRAFLIFQNVKNLVDLFSAITAKSSLIFNSLNRNIGRYVINTKWLKKKILEKNLLIYGVTGHRVAKQSERTLAARSYLWPVDTNRWAGWDRYHGDGEFNIIFHRNTYVIVNNRTLNLFRFMKEI